MDHKLPIKNFKKFIILILSLIFPILIYAQQIKYDENFADNGKLLLDKGGNQISSLEENINGEIYTFGSYKEENKNFIIIHKFDSSGNVVKSFGVNGQLKKLLDNNYDFFIKSSLIVETGEMYLSGNLIHSENKSGFAVLKLYPDGYFDESFGVNGFFVDTSNLSILFGKIFKYEAGKLLIVGSDENNDSKIKLLVLNPNGLIDSLFGNNGLKLITPIAPYTKLEFKNVVFDNNKNIFLLTNATTSFGERDFVLFKLNIYGVVDTTFCNQGSKIIDIGGYETGGAMLLTSQDKIIISGQSAYYEAGIKKYRYSMIIRRFNIDGSIDQNFGTNGNIEYLGDNIETLIPYSIIEVSDKTFILNILNIVNFTNSNIIHSLFNDNGEKVIMDDDNLYFKENFLNSNNFINGESQDLKGKILNFGRIYSNDGFSKSYLCRLFVDYSVQTNPDLEFTNKLTVAPNIVSNHCFINYEIKSDDNIEMELISGDGKIIKQIIANKYLKAGAYDSFLDVKNLDAGLYFCKLTTTKGIIIAKFIKL